jgi:hypothetical protein
MPANKCRLSAVATTNCGRITTGLGIMCWLFVSALWLRTMWQLRNPFPYADDFNSCLRFLSDWIETGDLSLLFATYNEAPNFLLRLSVLGSYYLLGYVSFSALALVASLSPLIFSTLGVLWLTTHVSKNISHALILALPVLLIMAQPATWGSYLWATSAYIHGFLPCIAFAAVIALERGRIVPAVILAILAPCIGGAGFCITVFCAVYLIAQRRSRGLIWLGVTLVTCIVLWRIAAILSNDLLNRNVDSFLALRETAWGVTLYSLAFVGNSIDNPQATTAAILGGALLSVVVLSRGWRSPALFAVVFLACFAALASAVLRFPGGGLQHSLLSRYQTYSTACFAATYLLLILKTDRLRSILWLGAMAVTLALSVRSYTRIPAIVEIFNLRQAREVVASRFDTSIVIAEFPPRSATDHALQRAADDGVYRPDPTTFFHERIEHNVAMLKESAPLIMHVSLYRHDDQFVFARGFVAIQAQQLVQPRQVCLLAARRAEPDRNSRLCLPLIRGSDLRSSTIQLPTHLDPQKAVEFAVLLPKELVDVERDEIFLMVSGARNWHMRPLGLPETSP